MGTQDLSRSVFDPDKHYSSVRLQQGRVITDDDWNETRRIREELQRQVNVDMIGSAGSPNDGFRISPPSPGGGDIDFTIHPGDFYLGGHRLTLKSPQTYMQQDDWLQGPGAVSAPAGNRVDLVYLETTQQVVTAVEDSELFEVALGGADTTTRYRTQQRVHLRPNIGTSSCKEAWSTFKTKMETEGTWQTDNELVPNALLTVDFTDEGNGGDLCKPVAAGGYLGAENQALRVQLIDDETFTWGFDNASPLYRVEAAADRQTLTLVTPPKDQAHWPLAEQIVEILPWSAVLPNNEKVAEIRGHLSRVTATYDPDTGEITIADSVPTDDFDAWKTRTDQAALGENGEYYYLRVWNRGSDRESEPAIEFSPGTTVDLGYTGIEITFSGDEFRSGDYWIITARPQTPNQVVPWVLETGHGPLGVRRFYSPLAFIHWSATEDPYVTDCRPRFRPLTQQKVCCSFVVGDGISTFGDLDSIEEAVARLPDEGGEICLLPGLHQTNTVIREKQWITIKGCGHRTRVIPREESREQPIFTVVDSLNITLVNMELIALNNRAIVLSGSEPGSLHGVNIHDNHILAYQNAIHSIQSEQVSIKNNMIRMVDKASGDVAIYSLGDDVLIQDNDIGVVPPDVVPPADKGGDDGGGNPNPSDDCLHLELIYTNPIYIARYTTYVWTYDLHLFIPFNPYQTLGGIQIGSGSERVEIRHNRILGGAGNGITLGSDVDISDFEEPEQPEEFSVELKSRTIMGFATYQGKALVNEIVVFSNESEVEEAVTNNDGFFSAIVEEEGRFDVALSNPNYQISSIEKIEGGEFGIYYQIFVEDSEFDVDLQDVLAFIYQVTIEENRIRNMGESGIGFPRLDKEEALEILLELLQQKKLSGAIRILLVLIMLLFGVLTGVVIQLVIRNNSISGCLRNFFNSESTQLGRLFRGVGGISLAFCEDVKIYDNRIFENGTINRGPVQGIFIIYTTHAEISRNHITDNGPETPSQTQNPFSGGIFIFLAADLSTLVGSGKEKKATKEMAGFTIRKRITPLQVLRLQENVIEHTLGRGFTCLCAGAISITDNQVITWESTAADFDETLLAGIASRIPNLTSQLVLRILANSAGSFYINNLGRIGNSKVSGNQVTLVNPNVAGTSLSVQALTGIQFVHNHVQTGAGEIASNVVLMSSVVDASHNHIQEPSNPGGEQMFYNPVSMVTLGGNLNTTALNQSNHCVVAFGFPGQIQDVGNLVLNDTGGVCAKILPEFKMKALDYMATVYYNYR